MSNKSPFLLPENYFEQLEQDILRRSSQPSTKTLHLTRSFWFSTASVAACLLIVFTIWWQSPTEQKTFAQNNETSSSFKFLSNDNILNLARSSSSLLIPSSETYNLTLKDEDLKQLVLSYDLSIDDLDLLLSL